MAESLLPIEEFKINVPVNNDADIIVPNGKRLTSEAGSAQLLIEHDGVGDIRIETTDPGSDIELRGDKFVFFNTTNGANQIDVGNNGFRYQNVTSIFNNAFQVQLTQGGAFFSTFQPLILRNVGSGNDAWQGTATLVGGTVTITNNHVDAFSFILLMPTVQGGTPGVLAVTARSAGSPGSFTVTSSSGTDTSTFEWMIINLQ